LLIFGIYKIDIKLIFILNLIDKVKMSKSAKKTNAKKIDYSAYVVCVATGEDRLMENLVEIREQLGANFQIEMTGLHVGDILIGRLGEEVTWDQSVVAENFMKNKGDRQNLDSLKPLIMIERKSISDFCSSFSSQHYHNQKSRMMGFRQQTGCQCHLVVEGYYDAMDLSNYICKKPVSTLEQCFTSIRVRDNFFVKHVENTYFHADYIFKCLKTIEKYAIWKGNYCGIGDNLKKDFMESLKARKKSNLTPSMCFQLQISTIPNISNNMAEKIVEVYPNMRSLIEAFDQEGKHCLSEIKVGKNRFGKVKSERIFEYLDLENKNSKTKTKISLTKKK